MNGEDLQKRRKDLELTQENLAEKLGVSRNTVARWERGEVPMPPYLYRALNDIEAEQKKKK